MPMHGMFKKEKICKEHEKQKNQIVLKIVVSVFLEDVGVI